MIGAGDVTEIKSGPAFNKIANSQLMAVMRRNAEKVVEWDVDQKAEFEVMHEEFYN